MPSRAGIYKTPDELRRMLAPGLLTARALSAVRSAIRPGVSTLELDAIAETVIREAGGIPNFALEPGYSHTICASINEAVVHGVPTARPIEPGDIVSIDCGAMVDGWNGDAAFTVVVDDPSRPALVASRRALSEVTEVSLWAGVAAFATAKHLNEVGAAIEHTIDWAGSFGILEEYTGHGIGRSMHEEPPVFNYRVRSRGLKVRPGLVIAIEPMVTRGTIETGVLEDGWTVVTADGSDAAHWEHSVALHDDGIWVLTAADGGASGLARHGITPVRPR